ncbi:hypothetical protein HY491_01590 [Candidatus Woesearchaeota archaeon]|nr:hypothetical protein [Candidatus Woesearchaeota archaeon]
MARKKRLKKAATLPRASLNRIVYWTALLVAIVGNVIISAALIPFLIVLRDFPLTLVIFTLGLTFGMLFNQLIQDIEFVDRSHHIIAGIFIPGLAVVNIFIMTRLANQFIALFQVQNTPHSPLIISVNYLVAFVLPLFIRVVLRAKKK